MRLQPKAMTERLFVPERLSLLVLFRPRTHPGFLRIDRSTRAGARRECCAKQQHASIQGIQYNAKTTSSGLQVRMRMCRLHVCTPILTHAISPARFSAFHARGDADEMKFCSQVL